MGTSLTREAVLRRLADEGVATFTSREFRRWFPRSTRGVTYWWLGYLVDHGVLRRFLHGWYVVRGPAESEVLRDPMFLATRLADPSYVAFGSALHFHGWTEEAPGVTLVASPRYSRIHRIGRHPVRVVHLPPRRFFGSAPARHGSLEFAVADPEKAIVDAFYLPRCCGGMRNVVAALGAARPSLRLPRLQAYAVRMGSASLCSRLGYVLEHLGEEARALERHVSDGYVKLDSRGARKGRSSSRWHVIDNL